MSRLLLDATCYPFLTGILQEISVGLLDDSGKRYLVDVSPLRGILADTCLTQGQTPEPDRDALIALQHAYLERLAITKDSCWKVEAYPLVNLRPQLTRGAKTMPRADRSGKKMKPLALAIAIAEDDIGRCVDRILGLMFLESVWGHHGWPTSGALACHNEVYRTLVQQLQMCEARLMRLVLVEGDKTRIEALRKRVFNEYFEKTTVMGYLESGGRSPGGWSDKDERAFRRDLKRHAETSLVQA